MTKNKSASRLDGYLKRLREVDGISAVLEGRCRFAFKLLSQTVMALEGVTLKEPDACPGPDGDMVLFTWDTAEEHVEVEIPEEGDAEFFFVNRTTHETREWDAQVGEPIAGWWVQALARVGGTR